MQPLNNMQQGTQRQIVANKLQNVLLHVRREIRQTTTNIATLPYVHGVSQFTYVRNSHEARGFSSYTIKATEPQQTAKRSTGLGGEGEASAGWKPAPNKLSLDTVQ